MTKEKTQGKKLRDHGARVISYLEGLMALHMASPGSVLSISYGPLGTNRRES